MYFYCQKSGFIRVHKEINNTVTSHGKLNSQTIL